MRTLISFGLCFAAYLIGFCTELTFIYISCFICTVFRDNLNGSVTEFMCELIDRLTCCNLNLTNITDCCTLVAFTDTCGSLVLTGNGSMSCLFDNLCFESITSATISSLFTFGCTCCCCRCCPFTEIVSICINCYRFCLCVSTIKLTCEGLNTCCCTGCRCCDLSFIPRVCICVNC